MQQEKLSSSSKGKEYISDKTCNAIIRFDNMVNKEVLGKKDGGGLDEVSEWDQERKECGNEKVE